MRLYWRDMHHKKKLQYIADKIKAAQDQGMQIMPLTTQFREFTKDDAYAIAQLVYQMRIKEGAVPVGRKIGFTNPEMCAIYGL